MTVSSPWKSPAGELSLLIDERRAACLDVYRRDPTRVREDALKERATAEGGYGRKQILELVQNASDAMLEDSGRIEVRLTDDFLYVANQGSPFTREGVVALLYSHLSDKNDEQIGRFGLGFKSIAAISGCPEIFSHTVSFGFDATRARSEIQEVAPEIDESPALRLAWSVDPLERASSDPVLAEMMTWATTVVRVPCGDRHSLLSEDLKQFPGWFVLFARHVRQIELVNASEGTSRTISISSQGTEGYVLSDTSQKDDIGWKIFEHVHRPSPEALASAGAARRDEVKVSWAVQKTGRAGVGQLSAFFPVDEMTTLSGMLNAPWKLSDDRSSLIASPFNQEILEKVVPEIVASALPHLVEKDTPGRVLDLLPARGSESRGWADSILNQPVYTKLSAAESLPNLKGLLRRPRSIRIPPEKLSPQLQQRWADAVAKPDRWLHPSAVSTAERRSKAVRLVLEANGVVATAREWLEATTDEITPSRSITAIYLSAQLQNAHLASEKDLKSCRLVLLENGNVEVMQAGRVYLRRTDDEELSTFVHPEVAEDAIALQVLRAQGVSYYEQGGQLHELLQKMKGQGSVSWEAVWNAIRGLPAEDALEIVRRDLGGEPLMTLRVRSGDGQWVVPHTLLMPGAAIAVAGPQDRKALVDMNFHRPDHDVLGRIGLSKNLRARTNTPAESWVGGYKGTMAKQFIDAQNGSKPSPDKLVFPTRPVLGPLQLLPELSDASRVSMTRAVLAVADRTPFPITHQSNASYGKKFYPPPEIYRVREHGLLATSMGPQPCRMCLSPFSQDAASSELFVPVPSPDVVLPEDVQLLKLKKSIADFSWEDWEVLADVHRQRDAPDALARMYGYLAEVFEAPDKVLIRSTAGWEAHAPADVAVAADHSTHGLLREMGIPAMSLDDSAGRSALVDNWGLIDGREELRSDVTWDPLGEPVAMTDVYPPLRNYLYENDFELQRCASVSETVYIEGMGSRVRALRCRRESKTVLVTAERDADVLAQIAEVLEIDGLDRVGIAKALQQMEKQQNDKRISEIRYAPDDLTRLGRVVGESGLRAIIRRQALEAIESDKRRPLSLEELQKLAFDLYGYGALKKALKAIDADYLSPPSVWGGRSTARKWVRNLKFDPAWAGEQSQVRRDALLRVDGPAQPSGLHAYQREISSALRRMIGGEGPGRGLISLPTGAGKTRVAVEGLIRAFVKDGTLDGPILWIAESDELCEQAVGTWAYMWRAYGSSDRPLAISRYWGSNQLAEEPGSFQVVIASRQKLINAVGRPDHAWLADSSLVVVDEAHGSTATSYTTILDWLGRGRSRAERRLLLGLTATPFRNNNDKETQRLAQRFDQNRLDRNAFTDGVDPYSYLQEIDVLARVSQRELEGAELTLTPDEVEKLGELEFFPSWAEQRVGQDDERNERIVRSIRELPSDFPVLLFAVSVENAEVLAALLSFEGIPAASISANTPDDERGSIIDRFKAGELRVITNYNVLAQGFDAPAVRAVYITRPTYSQVLYQQMIGRGLRGPLNGGSEEVLIVNVKDNIVQYGQNLAFYDFEPLWSTDT